MARKSKSKQLFVDYFSEWVAIYKEGAVREVTLNKYYLTLSHLERIASEVRLCDLNKRVYQTIINEYAKTHERQTTMDFHHQIKGAILDALDEGLIDINPTRKIIIKGVQTKNKKQKYLNQYELQQLLRQLNLPYELNWDWFILLIAKTGLRFSEALAITPNDFDFNKQLLSINKTWNYKSGMGGFQPTKNRSSIRDIQLDWQTAMNFSQLITDLPQDKPIFVKKRPFNSTVNKRLAELCKQADVPVISLHGLRHTHASLLLYAGISIASVARRLGHSNMAITQKTYLHIITELENQDNSKMMQFLSSLI